MSPSNTVLQLSVSKQMSWYLLSYFFSIVSGFWTLSVFNYRTYENVTLLGYYAGNIRNFLQTFPLNVSVFEYVTGTRCVITQKNFAAKP